MAPCCHLNKADVFQHPVVLSLPLSLGPASPRFHLKLLSTDYLPSTALDAVDVIMNKINCRTWVFRSLSLMAVREPLCAPGVENGLGSVARVQRPLSSLSFGLCCSSSWSILSSPLHPPPQIHPAVTRHIPAISSLPGKIQWYTGRVFAQQISVQKTCLLRVFASSWGCKFQLLTCSSVSTEHRVTHHSRMFPPYRYMAYKTVWAQIMVK